MSMSVQAPAQAVPQRVAVAPATPGATAASRSAGDSYQPARSPAIGVKARAAAPAADNALADAFLSLAVVSHRAEGARQRPLVQAAGAAAFVGFGAAVVTAMCGAGGLAVGLLIAASCLAGLCLAELQLNRSR